MIYPEMFKYPLLRPNQYILRYLSMRIKMCTWDSRLVWHHANRYFWQFVRAIVEYLLWGHRVRIWPIPLSNRLWSLKYTIFTVNTPEEGVLRPLDGSTVNMRSEIFKLIPPKSTEWVRIDSLSSPVSYKWATHLLLSLAIGNTLIKTSPYSAVHPVNSSA